MNPKLSLAVCAVFLMIWSTSGQGTSTQKWRNYNGSIIFPGDERDPSTLCVKATNNSASYWIIPYGADICSEKIACSNWPEKDKVLDIAPDTGVKCDTAGQFACIDGTCQYLILEEVARQAELESQLRKIYSNYDGEVIGLRHDEFPDNLCHREFNDLAAEWSNRGDADACSAEIICYLPNHGGTRRNLHKTPENGVVLDSPFGRNICFNGQRKSVEYLRGR